MEQKELDFASSPQKLCDTVKNYGLPLEGDR